MSLRIRRGTETQRIGVTFDQGELLYTTDSKKLYIGDGVTAGGYDPARPVNGVAKSGLAGVGLSYNDSTGNLDVSLSTFTTNSLTEGSNNKYFTNQRAQDAFGALLAAGTQTGITMTYDSLLHKLNVSVVDTVGITSVSADTNPSLGGNLNIGNYSISSVGTGVINISGNITGGSISAATIRATTGLGANLSLNGYNLTGTGAVSLNVTSTFETRSLYDGVTSKGYYSSTISRGTFGSPTAVNSGDELGGLIVKGYSNSSTSAIAALISVIVDPTAVIAGGNYIKSIVAIAAATDTSQDIANAFTLDSAGVATSNAFVASKYTQLAVYANDTARTTAIPTPAKGMMVFMTSGTSPAVSNKAVVYNGSAWAVMPG